jgi:hypothetical protein
MKKLSIIGIMLVLAGCSSTPKSEQNESAIAVEEPKEVVINEIPIQSEPDSLKGSTQAMAKGEVGQAHISINYYSPAVRGRIIWGGLVPFDKVWSTGAHMATSLTTDQSLVVGDVTLDAGTYAIFTIPSKEEWTFIINRNWEQHLADDYDTKEDLVRIKVKPIIKEINQERLRYSITDLNESEGKIIIAWEKLEIPISIKLK